MSVPQRVFFIKMGWVQLLKSLSVKLIGETLLHAWHMIAILTHVMNGPWLKHVLTIFPSSFLKMQEINHLAIPTGNCVSLKIAVNFHHSEWIHEECKGEVF